MTMPPPNGWSAHEKLVLSEIRDLKQDVRGMQTDLTMIKSELAALKVKAGAWGALAGLIPFGLFIMTRAAS